MTKNTPLTPVRAGFIPLVDCAILAVAKEKGFAEVQGIDLQLYKEVSWANIRDRLNIGQFDVAHMLAGMPIAASLGIGHVKVKIIAPMAMNFGGNAITVSYDLFDDLRNTEEDLGSPLGAAAALRKVIDKRRESNAEPLSFGQVFPFSCHNYQLRYWMASAGIDPDRDVRLVVIPPPFMVDSLKAGQIDGFCVGEPWNAQAASQDVGVVLLRSSKFWPTGPEKVLGVQQCWADKNPKTLQRLLAALVNAAEWANTPTNRAELSVLLSKPAYLNVPQPLIQSALDGDLSFNSLAEGKHALWLYAQMVRWGQTPLSKESEQIASLTYRPDLLGSATEKTATIPSTQERPLLDGVPFNATDVPGYIASLSIKR